LKFSLTVKDDRGSVSNNPAIVAVTVKAAQSLSASAGSNMTSSNTLARAISNVSTVNLSKNVGNDTSDNPNIAVFENNVYVVSEDDISISEDSTNVFLSKSTDGGSTFNDPINLRNIVEDSRTEESSGIAVSGSNVYVVWVDSTDTISDIIFKRIVS
jgi:hypothetical protein